MKDSLLTSKLDDSEYTDQHIEKALAIELSEVDFSEFERRKAPRKFSSAAEYENTLTNSESIKSNL